MQATCTHASLSFAGIDGMNKCKLDHATSAGNEYHCMGLRLLLPRSIAVIVVVLRLVCETGS